MKTCIRACLTCWPLLVLLFSGLARAQEGEGYCMACSREAWLGDSAALNKFIASCGVIDTVGYDSLNVEVKEKPVVKKITMKLNNGRVLYSDSIYLAPDAMPEYEGGMEGLFSHLKDNVRFPAEAARNGISGTVYAAFIVEPDGTINRVWIERAIGHGCDEEALRVVKTMKRWKPGAKNGKPVRVQMYLPVRFILK